MKVLTIQEFLSAAVCYFFLFIGIAESQFNTEESVLNSHKKGGAFQSRWRTQGACVSGCRSSPSCFSVDYHVSGNWCWFHSVTSICQELMSLAGIVHVHVKPARCVKNRHALRGIQQTQIRDAQTCVNRCTGSCAAADFDGNGNSCWFHLTPTYNCPQLRNYVNSNHYRRLSCRANSPQPAPAVPAPVPVPANQEAEARRRVKAQYATSHAFGGVREQGKATWWECVLSCSGACKSVDFDTSDNSCWHHSQAASCKTGGLSSWPSVTHYRLVDCGVSNDVLPQCGKPANTPLFGRIIGGAEARPHSWPWQAALRHLSTGFAKCAGTLVAPNWILTTAHCVDEDDVPSHWEVTLGAHDLNLQTEASRRSYRPTKVIMHARFDVTTFDYDVALLKLPSMVPLSQHISPVCLPQRDVSPGTSCAIVGWGAPVSSRRALHQAKVPVVGLATCRRSDWLGQEFDLTDRMICAGYQRGQVDSCQGDSGGPLMCQDPLTNTWYQYGITSFGRGCALAQKPGIYARVYSYLNWIKNVIANN